MNFPECWIDYKQKYGHYPENIDIELLNKLTITRLENSKAVETITFGKPKFDLNGDFVITTCRSEIMRVIRMSERNK